MTRLSWLAAVLAISFSSGCASNPIPPLSIGNQVDFNLLKDQFGNAFTYQDKMAMVLYVNGMKTKNLVRDAVADINRECLRDGRVVYLADVSGMPGLIAKLIAVPKMRSYDYPIWLDNNGLATESLPVKDDTVTVLAINKQAITAMDFYVDVAQLTQRLATECGMAAQQVAQQTDD